MTFNPTLQIIRSADEMDIQQLMRMGIHASHVAPAYKASPPSPEEIHEFIDRLIERVVSLSDSLYNINNMAHIVKDDLSGYNDEGLAYVIRRIDSGEAFGAELKDLRTIKAIAEVIADADALNVAIDSQNWKMATRIISKYAPASKGSRRSNPRAKEMRASREERRGVQ